MITVAISVDLLYTPRSPHSTYIHTSLVLIIFYSFLLTKNTFCGTWHLPHSKSTTTYNNIFHCTCTKRPYFHFRSKIWCHHHRVPRPRFPLERKNFGWKSIKKCEGKSARRRTHGQRQTGFIICSTLYAIAVGQIITAEILFLSVRTAAERNKACETDRNVQMVLLCGTMDGKAYSEHTNTNTNALARYNQQIDGLKHTYAGWGISNALSTVILNIHTYGRRH